MVNGRRQDIPAMFSALSKARELLVSHWHVTSYATSDIWDHTSEKLPVIPQAGTWQRKSISILARWSSAFDTYSNTRGHHLTVVKKKGIATLRILKELGSTIMMLTGMMMDDERKWDIFCPMFQNVVTLAEEIVELDLSSTIEKPPFCIEMALVRPLFEVSIVSPFEDVLICVGYVHVVSKYGL
jgi:hypothetical protein